MIIGALERRVDLCAWHRISQPRSARRYRKLVTGNILRYPMKRQMKPFCEESSDHPHKLIHRRVGPVLQVQRVFGIEPGRSGDTFTMSVRMNTADEIPKADSGIDRASRIRTPRPTAKMIHPHGVDGPDRSGLETERLRNLRNTGDAREQNDYRDPHRTLLLRRRNIPPCSRPTPEFPVTHASIGPRKQAAPDPTSGTPRRHRRDLFPHPSPAVSPAISIVSQLFW